VKDVCPYWHEEDCEMCSLTFKPCSCGADVFICEFPEWIRKKKEKKDVPQCD